MPTLACVLMRGWLGKNHQGDLIKITNVQATTVNSVFKSFSDESDIQLDLKFNVLRKVT